MANNGVACPGGGSGCVFVSNPTVVVAAVPSIPAIDVVIQYDFKGPDGIRGARASEVGLQSRPDALAMIRRGSTQSAPARHPETGAIAVLAAVIFVAVGSFVALSLNVALKMSAKVQLQTAFDGAALAGVMSLNGSEQGLCDASTTALRVAGMHALDAASVQIAGSDAVAGY